MKSILLPGATALAALALAAPAGAAPFAFSNGNVTDQMAVASRPDTAGKFEIEAGDDFILTQQTSITAASFTGLLPAGMALSSVSDVVIEIYRVFPKDSADPPSGHVPTRTNSPSDVAFDSRSDSGGTLSFAGTIVATAFAASNSVQPGGIHASPNQTTGGDGAVSGEEVRFDVTFSTPFNLPADHYFFVPQVAVGGANDNFFWLSSVRPIVPPGTPFTPDLQAWTRDAALDPDWLRVGTDIVGGTTPPTFNLAFSLEGETIAAVPEPGTLALLAGGLGLLAARARRRRS